MNNNGCSRVQRRQNNESNLIVEMKATAAQQQFLFFLSLLVAFVFAILIFGASFAADFVGVTGAWRGVAWQQLFSHAESDSTNGREKIGETGKMKFHNQKRKFPFDSQLCFLPSFEPNILPLPLLSYGTCIS